MELYHADTSGLLAGMTMRRAFWMLAAAYAVAPGHPDTFFHGIPLGLWPLAVVAIAVFACASLRDEVVVPDRWRLGVVALAALLVAKVVVAALAPTVGWQGWYFASDDFSGRVRRSTDFPRLDATRIDRALAFRDDYFPVYFLNEADFNRGIRREVTEPVTVRWVGHVAPLEPTPVRLTLAVKGQATLGLDGTPLLEATTASGTVVRSVTLQPGDRELVVSYLKTRDTDPLIELHGLDAGGSRGSLMVTPQVVAPWRRALYGPATIAAWLIDAVAVLLFAFVMWPPASSRVRRASPALQHVFDPGSLMTGMFALLVAQGLQISATLVHRAMSLSGGDDWLGFEARAREVVTGGLLMRFGKPLFSGEVFYYYPGYSYFLAAVHRLTGEDLAGPVFVHFLLLFATNLVVYRITVAIFDRRVAVFGVAALLGIEEIAFIRHYTVVLLSENLYVLTVSLALYALVRYIESGRLRLVAWAGVASGVSSAVRPALLLFLAPAVLVVAAASWRRSGITRWSSSVTAALVFVACWLGCVAPFTIRNYLVAGQPVLISDSPTHTIVLYNLPSKNADTYLRAHAGGFLSAGSVLVKIAVEQPRDMWRNVTTKIGFSFGMLQWMGGNLHPELVAASAGYLLAIVLVPAARSLLTWPIHAFVLAHLAGLVLTMPSNYGYRLILPMYLFFPAFGSRLILGAAQRFRLPGTAGSTAVGSDARV